MIELKAVEGGVMLPVQARPGARNNAVVGVHNGRLKVAVTEVPEKGKANSAIVTVLVRTLGVKKSQVLLVRGATSRNKDFLISELDEAVLAQRIASCGATGE